MKGALVRISDGAIVKAGDLPFTHVLADGGTALLTAVGQEVPAHAPAYRLYLYIEAAFDRPGEHFTQGADVETRDADTITVTRQWTPWTAQEIAAAVAARRDSVASRFDNVEDIERAAVLVLADELNRHSARLAAILQAAADASSLATFKTAMAQIQPIPQRLPADLKAAIRQKLGNGS